MTPPPPSSGAGARAAEASLPSPVEKTNKPYATTSSTWPEDRAPFGTAEERETILTGMPVGSAAQSIHVPVPKLVHDFRLSCKWASLVPLGKGCWGERTWVGLGEGNWSAVWGKGKIVPGGSDAQLMTDHYTAITDTRYLLATDDADPAHILVRTEGWRTGPPAVLERLLDPVEGAKVPCEEFRVRIFIKFETGDPRYLFLNEGMWVGSAVRNGLEIIYDGYRVL